LSNSCGVEWDEGKNLRGGQMREQSKNKVEERKRSRKRNKRKQKCRKKQR
jgi:hypothetical protein